MESIRRSHRRSQSAASPARPLNITKDKIVTFGLIPFALFIFSFGLRLWFFSGFILGDDSEEFILIKNILENGPTFQGHLQYRFTMWLFNVLFFKWFGISETAFFLPTWIMSATFGAVGYLILIRYGYGRRGAALGGLLVASAPFEVLIGTVRANDLILSWFLAFALLALIYFEDRPTLQGGALATLLWLAFYTKLWAVYLLPAIGIYYLFQFLRKREWRGCADFTLYSFLLHAIAASFWKLKTGTYFPFLHSISATYPVAQPELISLFRQYPQMVLFGSEFGTTLFGAVPYLLLALLLFKTLAIFSKRSINNFPFDRLDLILLISYGSFFLLLNFFPNSFKFDRYYSAPRIFRYLTPLSFPMSLHLAKLILDLGRIDSRRVAFKPLVMSSFLTFLIFINIYQADEATKPGRIYRKTLLSAVRDIKEQSPPQLLVEYWLSFFMREVYLKPEDNRTFIVPIAERYRAKEYEDWLQKNQTNLPEGTMLITGLGSYVHYGAHFDGYRLRQFKEKLDPRWKLIKEYGLLSYLPIPEPARLWRLSGEISSSEKIRSSDPDDPSRINDMDTLFDAGIRHFDKNNYAKARVYFKKIIEEFPDAPKAVDALYFHTICDFREGNWKTTIAEFNRLIERYPQSIWVAAAHYHIGLSYKELRETKQARKEFEYVIDHFPKDTYMVNLSRDQMKE